VAREVPNAAGIRERYRRCGIFSLRESDGVCLACRFSHLIVPQIPHFATKRISITSDSCFFDGFGFDVVYAILKHTSA
jgi:hypothetical protein